MGQAAHAITVESRRPRNQFRLDGPHPLKGGCRFPESSMEECLPRMVSTQPIRGLRDLPPWWEYATTGYWTRSKGSVELMQIGLPWVWINSSTIVYNYIYSSTKMDLDEYLGADYRQCLKCWYSLASSAGADWCSTEDSLYKGEVKMRPLILFMQSPGKDSESKGLHLQVYQ